jgi:hypothetical protein
MAAAFTVPDGVFAPVFCANNYFSDTKSIKKILCKKPTHGCDNGICMGVNYIFSLKKPMS